jgi:hypothetical protein
MKHFQKFIHLAYFGNIHTNIAKYVGCEMFAPKYDNVRGQCYNLKLSAIIANFRRKIGQTYMFVYFYFKYV